MYSLNKGTGAFYLFFNKNQITTLKNSENQKVRNGAKDLFSSNILNRYFATSSKKLPNKMPSTRISL